MKMKPVTIILNTFRQNKVSLHYQLEVIDLSVI